MVRALERFNIPTKVIDVIKAFYADPRFVVKIKDEKSETKRQNSGIRQGCPLSPYLFLLVMTVMFTDIQNRCRNFIRHGKLPYINFQKYYTQTTPY